MLLPDLFLEARFALLLALIKISENSQHQWLGKAQELSTLFLPCCCYLYDSLLLIVCFQSSVYGIDKKRKNLLKGSWSLFIKCSESDTKQERGQVQKERGFSHVVVYM